MLKNRGRRDIKLTLPPQSSIQEVLVNGNPVRARAEGEQISVSIPKSQRVELKLRYEVKRNSEERSHYHLIAPMSDLRTTNISWNTYFPENLQMWSWSGPLRVKENSVAFTVEFNDRFTDLRCEQQMGYDLLSPGQEALYLKLHLRGKISS